MMNGMDELDIARKLNFETPQKDINFEWKIEEKISRNLFGTHKK